MAQKVALFVGNSKIPVKDRVGLLPKPQDLFRNVAKKYDRGPEPGCFYMDLFKKRDEQDKLSYDTANQTAGTWNDFVSCERKQSLVLSRLLKIVTGKRRKRDIKSGYQKGNSGGGEETTG